MARKCSLAVLSLVLVAILAPAARPAESLLKLVPDSATGFTMVSHLGAADAKIQQLGQTLELPLPGLLARIKAMGLREGLDENGSAGLLFFVPSASGPAATIVLLPVTDYAKFVAQLNPGEAEGGITKIEFQGGKGFVRSIGGYAAMTDAPHRDALEKELKLADRIPADLAPLEAWIAETDVAAVLTRQGIKITSANVQAEMRRMKETFKRIRDTQPQGDPMADQMKQAAAVMDVYAGLFEAMDREVAVCGAGAQLDKANVLRITTRTRMIAGGRWAQFVSQVQPAKENVLAGLPAGPFMLAGGGVVDPKVWEGMTQFYVAMMKNMPSSYGMSEEMAKEVTASWLPIMKRTRGMAMTFGAPPSGAPLFSGTVATMHADDPMAFMADYEKAMKKYAEVVAKADNPVLTVPDIQKATIAGIPGLEIAVRPPRIPADQRSARQTKMMDAIFGPEGKMTAWVVPADAHTIVFGYSKPRVEAAIQSIKQAKPGLSADPEVAKVSAMLPPGAPWVGFWSPKGTVDFVGSMLPALGASVPLPDVTATPPIGLAITTAPDELQTVAVVPAEVLKAVSSTLRNFQIKRAAAPSPTEE